MLIRFTVENHLSFREPTTLNMVKSLERQLPQHIYEDNPSGHKLLRGAIIYGANAAGKSNLIHCLQTARDYIVLGIEIPQRKAFKLSTEHRQSPSKFEFEIAVEEFAYRYGFEVIEGKPIKEWLYEIESNKEPKQIYTRHIDQTSTVLELGVRIERLLGSKTKAKTLHDLIVSTPSDKLVLSDIGRRNLDELIGTDVARFLMLPFIWFLEKLEIKRVGEKADPYDLERLLESNDEKFKSQIENVLRACDIGNSRIEFQEYTGDLNALFPSKEFLDHLHSLKEGERTFLEIGRRRYLFKKEADRVIVLRMLVVKLDNNNEENFFELNEESEGTRRIIDLISLFLRNQTDRTIIIDEMDRSLHPAVTRYFHQMHFSEQNNNQLILATHEHYLLSQDFYRRDEIWFAEKDATGNSELRRLSDRESGLRFDKELRRDYLQGKYGAVPAMGEIVSN